MKETILTFLSIAAVIGGLVTLHAVPYNGYFSDNLGEAFIGVILLAGGLTRFWMKSRFHRKDSN